MVREFLELAIEESFTLDYKRNGDGALETIAAMANTYGGLVLVGVDADPQAKDRPGPVVGVMAAEKERLVNKIATSLDPAWWCPEVVTVPIDGQDKVLLVVRIGVTDTPRPVLHSGCARVRIDGRNVIADRRMLRSLFEDSESPAARVLFEAPHLWADEYQASSGRFDPRPDVTVRALCTRTLRVGTPRPRLGGDAARALIAALSQSVARGVGMPNFALTELMEQVGGGPISPWKIDPSYAHSRFLRLGSGHGDFGKAGRPALRVECGSEVAGGDRALEIRTWIDVHRWMGDALVPFSEVHKACREAVRTLTQLTLPAVTELLVGTALLPLPFIDLQIVGKTEVDTGAPVPLETIVDLTPLGDRYGGQVISRGGEYLSNDLVGKDSWNDAVSDALTVIAMDWRFLDPRL